MIQPPKSLYYLGDDESLLNARQCTTPDDKTSYGSAADIAAAGYGYYLGGFDIITSADIDAVTRISQFNGVTSLVAGMSISAAGYYSTGYGNADKGYISGGLAGTYVATTERLTYATEILAAVVGANLLTAAYGATAVGDAAGGFILGGKTAGGIVGTATKNTYSTETTAYVPAADLTYAKYKLGAAGNLTAGYFTGGSGSGTEAQRRATDKLTYSTETTAAVPSADMVVGTLSRNVQGSGNLETGYFTGSLLGSELEVLNYATDTMSAGTLLSSPIFSIEAHVGSLRGTYLGSLPPTYLDYTTGLSHVAAATAIPDYWFSAGISQGVFS